jgi:hypothetical protein
MEREYENWTAPRRDCEGIRAQDILLSLLERIRFPEHLNSLPIHLGLLKATMIIAAMTRRRSDAPSASVIGIGRLNLGFAVRIHDKTNWARSQGNRPPAHKEAASFPGQ